ncbi:TcpE family conjugal transfer membrane protein [Nonomuraea sp. NPDC049758]|uniref:TcpE family conjugal transfer membrane protein n=1 Tax=Nonomuraea sp. NPDC049758 TaxID=3154360 RepID=UPI00342231A0
MDLPTYTNIWRIEKRLYKLYDLRLPMPLPIVWIGVFVGVFVPWSLLLILVGVPVAMPWHVLFLVPPGIVTWLSTRPVIEGKRLTELLESQLRYLGQPKAWYRLAPTSEPEAVTFSGRIWRTTPVRVKAKAARKSRQPQRKREGQRITGPRQVRPAVAAAAAAAQQAPVAEARTGWGSRTRRGTAPALAPQARRPAPAFGRDVPLVLVPGDENGPALPPVEHDVAAGELASRELTGGALPARPRRAAPARRSERDTPGHETVGSEAAAPEAAVPEERDASETAQPSARRGSTSRASGERTDSDRASGERTDAAAGEVQGGPGAVVPIRSAEGLRPVAGKPIDTEALRRLRRLAATADAPGEAAGRADGERGVAERRDDVAGRRESTDDRRQGVTGRPEGVGREDENTVARDQHRKGQPPRVAPGAVILGAQRSWPPVDPDAKPLSGPPLRLEDQIPTPHPPADNSPAGEAGQVGEGTHTGESVPLEESAHAGETAHPGERTRTGAGAPTAEGTRTGAGAPTAEDESAGEGAFVTETAPAAGPDAPSPDAPDAERSSETAHEAAAEAATRSEAPTGSEASVGGEDVAERTVSGEVHVSSGPAVTGEENVPAGQGTPDGRAGAGRRALSEGEDAVTEPGAAVEVSADAGAVVERSGGGRTEAAAGRSEGDGGVADEQAKPAEAYGEPGRDVAARRRPAGGRPGDGAGGRTGDRAGGRTGDRAGGFVAPVPVPRPGEGGRPAEGRVRRVESVVGRDSGGWRRIAQVVVGGGGVRTDGSEIDEARARAVFGGSRRIVVLGCTGGAGQSTTALMLGHTFATYRDDRIVAVDANTGGTTLTSRIEPETPETLTSLLSGLDQVSGYLTMRGFTTRTASGLEVISADTDAGAEQRLADRSFFSDHRLGESMRLLDRHYKLSVIDPAAALAARILPYADQLVLVVPASEEAAEAVAMTYEWLDGHGCGELRRRAVMVVNGVSRRSMADVEQAEAVARGRCRAIVRVPWEDGLAPGGAEIVDPGQLRAAGRRAYLALAGVVVAGFAVQAHGQAVRPSEEELASDPPGTRIGER